MFALLCGASFNIPWEEIIKFYEFPIAHKIGKINNFENNITKWTKCFIHSKISFVVVFVGLKYDIIILQNGWLVWSSKQK